MDQQESTKKIRNHGKLGWIMAGISAGLLVLLIAALAHPSPSAKYKAALASGDSSAWAVINPASISVAFHITNTGDAAGDPTCTVDAEDPNYSYTGVNVGQLGSDIQPGQTITTAMPVTITHQGAQYVTQASVSCQ